MAPHGQENKFLYDFSAAGGFCQPLTCDDTREERDYYKGRLTAAFRVSFALIKRSDLVLLDDDGKVIDHGSCKFMQLESTRWILDSKAFVHRARPDVTCAAHAHSVSGRTLSGLSLPLALISQHAFFYSEIALYDQFDGIVLGSTERNAIADTIGGQKAAILRNHGLLTAGASVEALSFDLPHLNASVTLSLFSWPLVLTHALVTLKEVSHAEAQETCEKLGQHASS
ncbi:hypothetical protein MY3296_009971 [Beauveria thailandica]